MSTIKVKPHRMNMTQVFIKCPYCAKEHVHGTARGNYAGTRVAHCLDSQNKEYYIENVVDFKQVEALDFEGKDWVSK